MAKKTTKANAKSTKKKISKKSQCLSKKELETYRTLLIEKWQEIVGDVTTMEENLFQGGGELSSMPVHMADVGSDSFEQDFGLDLLAEEKKILVEIQNALKRIETGEFGICEGLGVPIEKRRLEAIPWTRYSLEYAQQLEQGQGGFRYRALKSRPIDIDREDDVADDEDDEDNSGDQVESEEEMESLDALEEEDDEDEDERDV